MNITWKNMTLVEKVCEVLAWVLFVVSGILLVLHIADIWEDTVIWYLALNYLSSVLFQVKLFRTNPKLAIFVIVFVSAFLLLLIVLCLRTF